MTPNFFVFKVDFYDKISGTAMGFSFAVEIAELVMQNVENAINSCKGRVIYHDIFNQFT